MPEHLANLLGQDLTLPSPVFLKQRELSHAGHGDCIGAAQEDPSLATLSSRAQHFVS